MAKSMIVVIDGMGGGIGKAIVERLKVIIPEAEVVAIGTNPVAMANMVKSGADQGFFGEEKIVEYAPKADFIMGVIGILIHEGLKGELTGRMFGAITSSPAPKILVPMNKCGIKIACADAPLSQHIEEAVALAKQEL